MKPQRVDEYWPWFFLAVALESAAAALLLARVPSEGLSAARLALFGILLASGAISAYFALRPPRWLDSLKHPASILAMALLSVVWGVLLFLLRYLDPGRLLPFYERLSPVLVFFELVSVEAFVFLLTLRNGIHLKRLASRRSTLKPAVLFFAFLLLVFLLITTTRLGLTPDPAYPGEPGVAIQGWQFVLALLGGLATLALTLHTGGSGDNRSARVIPFVIYLVAVAIWLGVPIEVLKNGFYVSMDPPTYQPFPYSDAGYYDMWAQSLFIGQPYHGEIPARPLYVVLLAGLHLLFGQHYDLIIAGQTLILALIPVLLYLLGEKIHSRAAGVIAALFFIFREWTTLLISSDTRVANTKTLLSDLPTMLLILLCCLLVMRWLERPDGKRALIAGGTFGVLLLLRTQSLLLIPVLLLLAAFVLGIRNRSFFRLSALFLAGVLVSVFPWLLHNYLQTGQITFDAAFQYKTLASQYAYTGNLDLAHFDFAGRGLGEVLLEFTLHDPGFVFGFIANHFLAGWVGGLLALPLFQTYNGIFEPINLYWLNWGGHIGPHNVALVLGYLSIIALGLGISWRRWRWIGLIPLAFNAGYVLATSIGRFSGWRYDLPADWVPYFYFAVGFAELLGMLASMFGAARQADEYAGSQTAPPLGEASDFGFRKLFPVAASFALLGGLPWIVTTFASPRYQDQSPGGLIARMSTIPGTPEGEQVKSFLAQPDTVLIEGSLLYPRYLPRDRGISSANPWPAYATRDYAREGFRLMNQSVRDAVFPTRDPLNLPQAADAILLGCQREDYIEVRLIAFPGLDQSYLSAPLDQPCK